MKRFLPWLLVPVAAWWGYRSVPTVETPVAVVSERDVSVVAKETTILAEADREGLQRRADELMALDSWSENHRGLRLACARWAELDPVAGLAWAAEQQEGWARQLRIWILLDWALLDSKSAWEAIPDGAEGKEDRIAVTGELLYENPAIFMEWFRRVKSPLPDGSPAWARIVERYPGEVAEIALAVMEEMDDRGNVDRYELGQLFGLLGRHRAERDPEATLVWALGLPPAVASAALTGLLDAWADADPSIAWERFSSEELRTLYHQSGLGNGREVGAKILALIGEKDPAKAVGLILDAQQKDAVHQFGGIAGIRKFMSDALASGEMEPMEAYRLLAQATGRNSSLPLNVFRGIWFGLPREALESTARELVAESSAYHRDLALGGIAAALFNQNPEQAMSFIATVEDGEMRRQMFSRGIRDMIDGQVDPQIQALWLARLSEKDRAGVAIDLMTPYGIPKDVVNWGSTATPSADVVADLLRGVPPSAEFNQAAETSAKIWAVASPSEAITWADSLENPEARAAAYSGVFDTWAYHDPFAAAEWLVDQQPGAERDAAVLPLVRRLGDSDPEGGWEWASVIEDPSMQMEARIEAMKAWSLQFPDDAGVALQDYLRSLSPLQAEDFTRRYTEK